MGSLTSRSLFSLIVGLLIVAVAYDFRTVGCLNGLDRMNEDRVRDEAMDDDRVKLIREEVLGARNMRILETCGHSRPYNLEVIICEKSRTYLIQAALTFISAATRSQNAQMPSQPGLKLLTAAKLFCRNQNFFLCPPAALLSSVEHIQPTNRSSRGTVVGHAERYRTRRIINCRLMNRIG
jgi:hypothetical protein